MQWDFASESGRLSSHYSIYVTGKYDDMNKLKIVFPCDPTWITIF